MTRTLVLLWVVCLTASAGVLIAAGAKAASNGSSAHNARTELEAIGFQAIELRALQRSTRELPARPAVGLPTKVSSAIARAGLPASTLQSLSPETRGGDIGLASSGAAGRHPVRQRATLALANLSLPQVGAFLDAWPTAEPDWTVAAIDLTPHPSRDVPSIGMDLPLRAIIVVEGMFQERPVGVPR